MKSILIIIVSLGSLVSCLQPNLRNAKSGSKTENGEYRISSKGIKFKNATDQSFEGIKTEAIAANKIIFLDVYAQWCGPCKFMDSNVFNRVPVADKFNDQFINSKLDAEDFEGVNLALKYRVNSYPTYLFLTPTGEVLYRLEGVYTVEGMVEEANFALSLYQ